MIPIAHEGMTPPTLLAGVTGGTACVDWRPLNPKYQGRIQTLAIMFRSTRETAQVYDLRFARSISPYEPVQLCRFACLRHPIRVRTHHAEHQQKESQIRGHIYV